MVCGGAKCGRRNTARCMKWPRKSADGTEWEGRYARSVWAGIVKGLRAAQLKSYGSSLIRRKRTVSSPKRLCLILSYSCPFLGSAEPVIKFVCVYLLTPWTRVLLENWFKLAKKFPAFYGIRGFITAFTNACHRCLTWVTSIPSMPSHPTSWRSIWILSFHLCLGLPSGLFPSGFFTKTLQTKIRICNTKS